MTDSQHRLLLGHFDRWSREKGRAADLGVLELLLDLRSTYDELDPAYWPAGSVEDLLVRLVPAKGPQDAFPEETIAESLDSYFRFLRNTGRMAARSASPAELSKEARRSVRRMNEAAADRANWSSGKVLTEFGAQLGVSLDDAPDIETMQSRLDTITEAWNVLPVHERQRQMPMPSDRRDQSGRDRAVAAFDQDDHIDLIILGFRYEMPTGDLPPLADAALDVESSGLMRGVRALADWVDPRAELTSTGVLRPAAAHQAYDDLGLREWERGRLRTSYQHWIPPRVAEVGVDAFVEKRLDDAWRTARDCEALDRLWDAATGCGVIEIRGKWAYPGQVDQSDAEAVVTLALRAAVPVWERYLEFVSVRIALLYALLRSYVRGCAVIPWAEAIDFALDWNYSPDDLERNAEFGGHLARFEWSSLASARYAMSDVGIFIPTENGLALTPFGDVFMTSWLDWRQQSGA
jgi:hypothetical protein